MKINLSQLLDRVLDPVGRALTPDAARRLLEVRADAELQQRVEELAERCNEDLLSPEEREEYELLVQVDTLVAILKAKARAMLAHTARA